ncbi:hypothetical protein [Mycobacteroides immunogenum]|nr:hypothetical protein [Mycobacteroides immunogenum]
MTQITPPTSRPGGLSDLEDRRRRIEECKARHPSNYLRSMK